VAAVFSEAAVSFVLNGESIMRMFIFKSQPNPTLHAFAAEQGGRQLPEQFGPWHAIGVVREDAAPPYNLSRETIEEGIANQGFALFRKKAKKAD
jgi:hypothetical protein